MTWRSPRTWTPTTWAWVVVVVLAVLLTVFVGLCSPSRLPPPA